LCGRVSKTTATLTIAFEGSGEKNIKFGTGCLERQAVNPLGE